MRIVVPLGGLLMSALVVGCGAGASSALRVRDSVRGCQASDLSAVSAHQGAYVGTGTFVLTVKNTASVACSLSNDVRVVAPKGPAELSLPVHVVSSPAIAVAPGDLATFSFQEFTGVCPLSYAEVSFPDASVEFAFGSLPETRGLFVDDCGNLVADPWVSGNAPHLGLDLPAAGSTPPLAVPSFEDVTPSGPTVTPSGPTTDVPGSSTGADTSTMTTSPSSTVTSASAAVN